MSNFENISEETFKYGIQHSFCRNLNLEQAEQNSSFKPVENFNFAGENEEFYLKKKFNDLMSKSKDHFMSTSSTQKSEGQGAFGNNTTCGVSGAYQAHIQGSANDILCSGFFGKKTEMGPLNRGFTNTKPFPLVEEERNVIRTAEDFNSNSAFEVLNPKFAFKRQRTDEENFNGSFLGGMSSNFGNAKTPKNVNRNSTTTTNNTNNTNFFSNMNTFSNYSTSSTSFNDLVKSVSLSSSLSKKKKSKIKYKLTLSFSEVLSSEELLIEKLNKEKINMQRLRSLNSQTLEKTKAYTPKPINPSPLTLIKPFNLSSNNNKMLAKKRIVNSNIDEVNNKITEQMKKKCEQVGEKIKDINDTMKLQKTPSNIKYMKKTLGRSRSKSPCKIASNDEDVQSLSSRIEKYCIISGMNLNTNTNFNAGITLTKNKSKSPVKICFGGLRENEEKLMNIHIGSILNNDSNFLNNSSTSIRRNFNFNNCNIPTEEKIAKEMQSFKFKAKPLNKHIFNNNNVNYLPVNKKQPELESFESVLQKTRMEKQMIEKKEKDMKKFNKVNLIKQSKVSRMMKSNKDKENEMEKESENFNNLNEELMLIE